MEVTPQDIRQLREAVGALDKKLTSAELKWDKKLDEINTALKGSGITKKGGIVDMLGEGDRRMDEIEARLTKVEKKSDRSETYIRWLFASAGFIAAAIISLFLHR